MGYRIDIYIGSDNGSRRMLADYLGKIVQWAGSVFPEGYTLTRGKGYYNGATEDSLVLSALTDYDIDVRDRVTELKGQLRQEAILVAKSYIEVEMV